MSWGVNHNHTVVRLVIYQTIWGQVGECCLEFGDEQGVDRREAIKGIKDITKLSATVIVGGGLHFLVVSNM